MIKKPTREQESEMRRQLTPWMIDRNLPLVLFDKLRYCDKVLLHNIVCLGTNSTPKQRLDLYKDLGLSEARSDGSSSNQVHEPTDKYLKEYFSPQASAGNIPYLKRF